METTRHGESSAGVGGLQSSALLPCGYRDLADPSISYHPGSGASPAVHRSNPPQKPAAAPGAGAAGVKALRRLGFTAVLGTLSAKTVDFPRPCPAPKGGQHPTAGQREGLTAWPPPPRGDPSPRPPDSRVPPGVSRGLLGARAAAQFSVYKPAFSLPSPRRACLRAQCPAPSRVQVRDPRAAAAGPSARGILQATSLGRDLPHPGSERVSLTSAALAGGFCTTSAAGKPPSKRRRPQVAPRMEITLFVPFRLMREST